MLQMIGCEARRFPFCEYLLARNNLIFPCRDRLLQYRYSP